MRGRRFFAVSLVFTNFICEIIYEELQKFSASGCGSVGVVMGAVGGWLAWIVGGGGAVDGQELFILIQRCYCMRIFHRSRSLIVRLGVFAGAKRGNRYVFREERVRPVIAGIGRACVFSHVIAIALSLAYTYRGVCRVGRVILVFFYVFFFGSVSRVFVFSRLPPTLSWAWVWFFYRARS